MQLISSQQSSQTTFAWPCHGLLQAILINSLLFVLLMLLTPPAHAIFQDDDARKQINVLTKNLADLNKNITIITDEYKTNQRAILVLSNANESLKTENAALKGKVEELEKTIEEIQGGLKSYFKELNDRLKQIEPEMVDIEGIKGPITPLEKQTYELALKEFQDGSASKAENLLNEFINKYPNSPYSPLANYWLANSKYANKDYKASITIAENLIKRYPDHPRTPEALITIANCQIETGKKADARKTLESIVKKYPTSKSASTAVTMIIALK